MFGAASRGRSWPPPRSCSSPRSGRPTRTCQPEPDTWIARLGALPLLAQPGERWLYNTGASGARGAAGPRRRAAARARCCSTRVFDPLGMTDTGVLDGGHRRGWPTAYRPTPDGLVAWDQPDGAWSQPPAFGDGAAGLLSTVDDLLAFARMLLPAARRCSLRPRPGR